MSAFPSFEKYESLAREFDLVPVYRRLLSDHLTPVSAFRLLDDGHSPACLFESVIGGEKIGRYSFIAIGPRSRVVAFRNNVEWHHNGQTTSQTVADPLAFLREKLGNLSVASLPDLHLSSVVPLAMQLTMLFATLKNFQTLRQMIAICRIWISVSMICSSFSTMSIKR